VAEADELRARWPELFGADGKVRRDARRVSHAPAEATR